MDKPSETALRRRCERARESGFLWRQRVAPHGEALPVAVVRLVSALERRATVLQEPGTLGITVWPKGKPPVVTWGHPWTAEAAFGDLALLGMALYASPQYVPFHGLREECEGEAVRLRNRIGKAFASGFLSEEGGTSNG